MLIPATETLHTLIPATQTLALLLITLLPSDFKILLTTHCDVMHCNAMKCMPLNVLFRNKYCCNLRDTYKICRFNFCREYHQINNICIDETLYQYLWSEYGLEYGEYFQ